MAAPSVVNATQANSTTVSIVGKTAGATPFISKFDVLVGNPAVLNSIRYTIVPKKGSVTRPLSATYTTSYLKEHGFFNAGIGQFTLPVWGLYAGYSNSVKVEYQFVDSSSKRQTLSVATAPFSDTCPYGNPNVLQARTNNTQLSYDYMLVTSGCSPNSPVILDTDGNVRWVGTADDFDRHAIFYDNAVYLSDGPRLLRIEMDGTVNVLADYTSRGVYGMHHNIDVGKHGLILDVDTHDYNGTVNIEVNPITGEVLNEWNFAAIISDAMIAGGDDPALFVEKYPGDWWHNNSTTYRRTDDTLIVSSRENFVIAVDYESKAIKWIFGDKTKAWYVNFPSLRQFALSAVNGPEPTGQHAVSITDDDHLLLFDNGNESDHHRPAGVHRDNSMPRKYKFDLQDKLMTQVWAYPNEPTVLSPYCSSVYEDAPENYLVTYATIGGFTTNNTARILGLTAAGEKVFDYRYPSNFCDVGYLALPIHLEQTSFPTSTPTPSPTPAPTATPTKLANISTRLRVATGNNVLIGGFIITGKQPKKLIARALGPSLPVAGALPNPKIQIYNSANELVAVNDNWQKAANRQTIIDTRIAPTNSLESAVLRSLTPGAYTAVITGANGGTGVGSIEIYDLDSSADSQLANISTRGMVQTGDDVMIGGFILAGPTQRKVIIRALGPSLRVPDKVNDPTLELFDANGNSLAKNDDWRSHQQRAIFATGVPPPNDRESAIVRTLAPGPYTAIVRGSNGGTGVALVEVYALE